MLMRFYFFALPVFILVLSSVPVHAKSDIRVENAKLCTQHIPTYERQYGVPSHLLSAIASTESGRYHDRLNILLPWPWTINVEGKGYYFNSKSEAIAAVRQYQAAGKRSIDIGCMQVNLRHHPRAFANLDQAFDPKYNVRYAASFLRQLYEEEKNWRKAASAYHSKTPSLGQKYASRIFRNWRTIINRLRLPESRSIQLADAQFDGRNLTPSNQGVKAVQLSRSSAPAKPAHTPVKMKVIKVTEMADDGPGNIMMIKPDVSSEALANARPVTPASNLVRVDQPLETFVHNATANIVRLDGQSRSEQTGDQVSLASAEPPSTKKTGPRFIFVD